MNVKIEQSWKDALRDEFDKDYFIKLTDFVRGEYLAGKSVYPAPANIFNAFNLCPIDNVRVVIIGQDPYHEPGQAHGLCFSVRDGVALPPSLRNIYKELESDVGANFPHPRFSMGAQTSATQENLSRPDDAGQVAPLQRSGDLTSWAQQGVLLLNSVLTVGAHVAASHAGKGWEQFTDAVIRALALRENIVYMLWGKYAQNKVSCINVNTNLILKSAHPSPLSAHAGFFGNKHFSKANDYLRQNGMAEIEW